MHQFLMSVCHKLDHIVAIDLRKANNIVTSDNLSRDFIGLEKTLRLTLRTPNKMSWSPGQWVYLNMPSISGWQSHPFTIASAYDADMPISGRSGSGKNDIEKSLRKERRRKGEERTVAGLSW